LRANRQPEFTQIDIEMTCPRPDDVMKVAEAMIASVYQKVLGIDVKPPFPRLSYSEAMDRFGVDKPDLRFGIELKNLSAAFNGTSFKVFAEVLGRGEAIYGIAVPGAHQLSRKDLDTITEGLKTRHGLGLAWVKVGPEGWQGPVAKFIGDSEKKLAVQIADLRDGDTMLMVAGDAEKVRPILGELRLQLGGRFNLRETGERKFLWVVDFPMFEYDAAEKRLGALHHPFTAPTSDDLAILDTHPLKARALAYDMVLNGEEMGGGSIRIHSRELQLKVLELLGITREEALDRFGFLIEALTYGAPPHGGIAFGVDRLIMMLCGTDSIRDVIAFPKTQKAVDLMSGAPSDVSPRQLKELFIKVTV
jgi:aspartyl-tRNA synthetase